MEVEDAEYEDVVTPEQPYLMVNGQRLVNVEYLKTKHIYVAAPCYGNQMYQQFANSLIQLAQKATTLGIPISFSFIGNESLVPRARNDLVSMFMESGATHLMFIDADIQFDPDQVFRMVARNKDVIGASYPMKGINWAAIRELVVAKGNEATDEEMRNASRHEVVRAEEAYDEDGVSVAYDLGTGFMLISRQAILDMIQSYPELKYRPENKTEEQAVWHYALFDTMIKDEHDMLRYLSEDYTFCRRYQALGKTIYLDRTVSLKHNGNYTFG